jgi:uncharacterized UBP type Zn finger protein
MSETKKCDHLETVQVKDLPGPIDGCPQCLESGSTWVSLRMCLVCGQVGCCDSSPNQHARKHWQETGHALIRSAQPGENWAWCFEDEVLFEDGID